MRVNVAFMGSSFVGRSASGTAQTALKLIHHLIISEYEKFQVVLLMKNTYDASLISKDPILSKAKIVVLPIVKGRFLKSSRQFYKTRPRDLPCKIDILHFTVPRFYPFYWSFPAEFFTCTFHAAGDITVKQEKIVFSKHIYNMIAKLQWRHLSRIYADSDFAVNEIADNYKIEKSKISKIDLGADQLMHSAVSKHSSIITDKINIVIVGRWQNYKNVHSPLLSIIRSNNLILRQANVVLIGKSNMLGNKKVKQVTSEFRSDNLKLLDYVTDAELKYIYQNATIVVHPSINEGFGLPAFEAFAEGCRLIVHKGTPASEYLSSQEGVYVGDMLNLDVIESLLLKAANDTKPDIESRINFIKNNGLTWQDAATKYVNSFLSIKSH